MLKILDDPFGHHGRRALRRRDGGHHAVLPVGHLIERRHIQAGDTGGGYQQFPPAPPLVPGAAVELQQLQQHVLPLTQAKDVDKGRHGLGVVGAGAACNDQGTLLPSVRRAQGQPGQVQHIEHIGVGQFIAQGKADYVKPRDGVAALQPVEGKPFSAHLGLHIPPGGKDPLTPDALLLIHQSIQDAYTQVGHADLIRIRKAECYPCVYTPAVLDHRVVFPSRIPCGLLYPGENHLHCPVHASPPAPHCLSMNYFTLWSKEWQVQFLSALHYGELQRNSLLASSAGLGYTIHRRFWLEHL